MTFPTVLGRATTTESVDATSHPIALDAAPSAGQGLLLCLTTDGAPTVTLPTGFTSVYNIAGGASEYRAVVGWKVADGTEGTSVTVTTSAAEKVAAIMLRVGGVHASTVAEANATGVSGATVSPDAPAVNPSWANEDTLWVAYVSHTEDTTTVTTAPASYTNLTQVRTSGGTALSNAGVATAERLLNDAGGSENPGPFTLSLAKNWRVNTIAVRPRAFAYPDVVVGGVKKPAVGASVIVGGVKRPVVGLSVVVAGVKKPVV